MNYTQLVLKSGRERSVNNRHPWLFSGGVKFRPKATPGSIVAVTSNNGDLLGYGHYHPESTLICRMFAFTSEPIEITEAFWEEKLANAMAYRKQIFATTEGGLEHTNGFRLIHAEGDGMPGVVADIYGKAASVQLRTDGAVTLLPVIQNFLVNELGIENIYLRTDHKDGGKGNWVLGEGGENIFVENGLKFHSDIENGQKTGFFLDQRENRAMLGTFSKGLRVLNAFSYSAAFSVYALAGGAREVHSVDISGAAVALAEQNVALNFGEDERHKAIKGDCFQFLKDLEPNTYDLIVLDPPAFTKHISTVDKAARGYKEINMKALQKVAENGFIFTYSCSQHISKDLFRKIVFGAAADAGREVRMVAQMGQGKDHPVDLFHPEGEYLKGLLLQVR
jgi:23S rRNA (cytosine1962-C5)-methyltransferase